MILHLLISELPTITGHLPKLNLIDCQCVAFSGMSTKFDLIRNCLYCFWYTVWRHSVLDSHRFLSDLCSGFLVTPFLPQYQMPHIHVTASLCTLDLLMVQWEFLMLRACSYGVGCHHLYTYLKVSASEYFILYPTMSLDSEYLIEIYSANIKVYGACLIICHICKHEFVLEMKL